MHKIGEDRTERLNIVPARLCVNVTLRSKFACRSCTDEVTWALVISHVIICGLPTEGSIEHVPVRKYADQQPHCRQIEILARAGLVCTGPV